MGTGLDGVALGPVHHGRRRREKKLMTMEEVETQFPQMSYKAWRAQRERMGLSTEGGVSAVCTEDAQVARDVLKRGSTSRPASIRSVRTAHSRRNSMPTIAQQDTNDSGIYEIGSTGQLHVHGTERHSVDITEEKPTSSGSGAGKRVSVAVDREVHDSPASDSRISISSPTAPPLAEENEAEAATAEADETEIQHLPEDIGSGDTCAICIDQLEEEDEVRGLSCGHAFHCSCVDVWLTTRRAICPLCKRDYWVRKSPPAGTPAEQGDALATGQQIVDRMNVNPAASRFGLWRTNPFNRTGTRETRTPPVAADADLEPGYVGPTATSPTTT